jgi:hypothetical protein
MTFPDDQVGELKWLCPTVQQCDECGQTYLLLPGLALPEGCSPINSDALLCPTERDGYPSRLFFADQVTTSAPLNWNANAVRILDRNWHAFSWKVNRNLRLVQMVAAHLRPLRCT